jgi:hypothetical protein
MHPLITAPHSVYICWCSRNVIATTIEGGVFTSNDFGVGASRKANQASQFFGFGFELEALTHSTLFLLYP